MLMDASAKQKNKTPVKKQKNEAFIFAFFPVMCVASCIQSPGAPYSIPFVPLYICSREIRAVTPLHPRTALRLTPHHQNGRG